LPDDCNIEYFDALCWLAEVGGEKIQVPEFAYFRGLRYLDDTGVWPWFQISPPPFPVPVCPDPFPEIGFLRGSDIEQQVLSSAGSLPKCQDAEATNARQQLLDVLETIVEDRLDVLAILLRN
jgi:hypothetical protein